MNSPPRGGPPSLLSWAAASKLSCSPIKDADSKEREDLLLLYILLSSALVLLGDVVSAVARSIVRRAS